jgi:hypothetical protein
MLESGRSRHARLAACWALVLTALRLSVEAQDGGAAGAERACLNHPTIRNIRVLNDTNIAFFTSDDTIYNNTLPKRCPTLRRGSLLTYAVENGQLCAGGRFTVSDRVGELAAFECRFGYFAPITEDELADLTVAVNPPERGRRGSRRSRGDATTTEVKLPPRETEVTPTPPPAP